MSILSNIYLESKLECQKKIFGLENKITEMESQKISDAKFREEESKLKDDQKKMREFLDSYQINKLRTENSELLSKISVLETNEKNLSLDRSKSENIIKKQEKEIQTNLVTKNVLEAENSRLQKRVDDSIKEIQSLGDEKQQLKDKLLVPPPHS